jgi:hypothetical protein
VTDLLQGEIFQVLGSRVKHAQSCLKALKEIHGSIACTRAEGEELYNASLDFKSDAWFSLTFEKHIPPILPQAQNLVSAGQSIDRVLQDRKIGRKHFEKLRENPGNLLLHDLVNLSIADEDRASSSTERSIASDIELPLYDALNSPLTETLRRLLVKAKDNAIPGAESHPSNAISSGPFHKPTESVLNLHCESLSNASVPPLTEGKSYPDSSRESSGTKKVAEKSPEKVASSEVMRQSTNCFIYGYRWEEWWKVDLAEEVDKHSQIQNKPKAPPVRFLYKSFFPY